MKFRRLPEETAARIDVEKIVLPDAVEQVAHCNLDSC
jgi:hypothetical protein